MEHDNISAPQTMNAKSSGIITNTFNQTTGPNQSVTTNLIPPGASSNATGFPGAAQTVGPANNNAGLFLPDIQTNRKSGMSHGQFKNASAGNPKQYVHRGSNSFSGMTAENAEAAVNA